MSKTFIFDASNNGACKTLLITRINQKSVNPIVDDFGDAPHPRGDYS